MLTPDSKKWAGGGEGMSQCPSVLNLIKIDLLGKAKSYDLSKGDVLSFEDKITLWN